MIEDIALIARALLGVVIVFVPLVMFAIICSVPLYILFYAVFST